MTRLRKLDELSLKTDRQLIPLIHTELDRSIRAARQVLKSADTHASAEPYYFTAKHSYARAAGLILLIRQMSVAERREVESKVEKLCEMLQALSAIGTKPTPTENEIAALARVLWKTRGCPEGLPEEDWFRAERALKPHSASNAVCVQC